ncbi:hypothetical protein ACIRJS_32850 [Streptomyces sp. NPDC102340]|uniref:hypothetical protein n=1 Tax=unclassified Streptomyces TaxID=2593676 RepID=UPI003813C0F5
MGWSSANGIFDPVARALIDAGVDDTTKRDVLGKMISNLQDGDWDTEDESLEDFLDDPAIVSAFSDHNVHLSDRRCCARELGVGPREALLLMRREDTSEQQMNEALHAYTHHLAETIRANRDHLRGSTMPATAVADWIADLIDPAEPSAIAHS